MHNKQLECEQSSFTVSVFSFRVQVKIMIILRFNFRNSSGIEKQKRKWTKIVEKYVDLKKTIK